MDRFQREGLTFDVRDGGPADAAQTVVLLHGFPQDASCWHRVEPLLHAQGLRTLAPDQRGYSPGARVTRRSAYSMTELSADIIALLDAAELDSAHIAGHDWGGAVAWILASNHPGRVRSVTTISTPHPRAMARSWVTSTQLLRSWYMLAFQLPRLPELAIERSDLAKTLEKSGLSAQSAQHSADLLAQPEALRCALNWYRGMPYTLRTPAHRTRVPATYVWGQHDEFLGRAAAQLTQRYVLADYSFVELDGGHWLPETHPERIAAAIHDRAAST